MKNRTDKVNCQKIRYDSFIPRLSGLVIAFAFWAIIMMSTLRAGLYEVQVPIISTLVLIAWTIAFYKSRGKEQYHWKEVLFFVLVTFIVAIAMTESLWQRQYFSLNPILAINSETEGIHRDTVYLGALMQGIKNYDCPSLLVNSSAFHNYHFGSLAILAGMSKLFHVDIYVLNCFLIPIILFPFFVSSIVSLVITLREYRRIGSKITKLDYGIVACFFVFAILPREISRDLGNLKDSWVMSISFTMSIQAVILYFLLLIRSLNSKRMEKRSFSLPFLLLITPAFILLVSTLKISTGLIFTFMVVYYLFRRYMWNWRYLLLELVYGIIFLFIYWFPGTLYSPFATQRNEMQFRLMDYLREYISTESWGLHILVCFCFVIVFLWYQLRGIPSFHDLKSGVKKKEYLVEETLLLTTVFGVIPGLVVHIGGASSYYFSSIQHIVGMILVLGYNIANELVPKREGKKGVITKAFMIFVIGMLSWNTLYSSAIKMKAVVSDILRSSESKAVDETEEGYWYCVKNINRITEDAKQDYYLYVDENASVWDRFANKDAALFFYPGLTGVVAIGELYYEDGLYHYNDGTPFLYAWGYEPSEPEYKLTLLDAIEKARADGKKGLIHIYEDSYKLITLE